MLWLSLEVGVGHAEAMVRAKLQEALPILIHLSNSKLCKAEGPRVMIGTNSGFKATEQDKMFASGDVLNDVVQAGIELIVCCLMSGWERRH